MKPIKLYRIVRDEPIGITSQNKGNNEACKKRFPHYVLANLIRRA